MRPFTPCIFSWYVYRCTCRRDQKKIEVIPAWIHKLPRLQQRENCKIWKIPYLTGGQSLENSKFCRQDLENSRPCWQDLENSRSYRQDLENSRPCRQDFENLDLAARFGKFKILQLTRVKSPLLTYHLVKLHEK